MLVLLTLTSILHAPSDQFSIADSWLKNAEDIHESTLQIFRVKFVCSNVFEGSFLVYFLHVRCVEKALVVIRPGQTPPQKKKTASEMPFFHRTAVAWWMPGLSKMPRV